jgi:polyphosphate kinase
MAKQPAYTVADRELSWLSFNARVLQEAEDETVSLGERLDFLAIVSSNLDEFFRVRVASLRSLLRLRKKSVAELGFDPRALLADIHAAVAAQQTRFGHVLRDQILPALRERGIVLIDESGVSEAQAAWLRQWFDAKIRHALRPVSLDGDEPPPFLENRRLYLVVDVRSDGPRIAEQPPVLDLVAIPTTLPRFVTLPEADGVRHVMFLDDVIRLNLPALFPGRRVAGAWAVKLTRDAELHLEDEFSVDLVDAIRKAVVKRAAGVPSRFLYDPDLPHAALARLQERLGLEAEDLVAGGRYHNLHDLFGFPRFELDGLGAEQPAPVPELDNAESILAAVAERDRLLHFPYQSYAPVVRFLSEASEDAAVEEIWITLYRIAKESAVVNALAHAARTGKRVTAFIELKARFDEETNLDCGALLEGAGARVLYSRPGLKVHAKLALIHRREGGEQQAYAFLGTGNFNEHTARIYADHALLTTDPRLTRDVRAVFAFLAGETATPNIEHLLVAPFTLRKQLRRMVKDEIAAAEAGRASGITLKLNSLEDTKAIRWLYDASAAGVPIQLIVRGICRLIPNVPNQSDNISVRSIVDRFLEHARIYRFHAGGEDRFYLASADWMTRNLDRRVEVTFPVFDPALKRELAEILDLQLADNVKARRIDAEMSNEYIRDGWPPVRAQVEIQRVLKRPSLAKALHVSVPKTTS